MRILEAIGCGCAFVDYDRDGWPDILLVNKPTAALFHNKGDGTFTDVTSRAGVGSKERALGVAAADFTGDGWPDIFVANDEGPNRLFRNNRNGTFSDVASLLGVAYGESGMALANMGVAVGDLDGDGKPDLAITTFGNQPYSVFHNEGKFFTDVSTASGIGRPTLAYLGVGADAFDADNEGDLDLIFANGHISPFIQHRISNQTYKQRNQLFLNDGHGHFTEVKQALPAADVRVHRGLAVGDVDNDGRVDVLITSNNDRPTLLHNDTPANDLGHWLELTLLDRHGCASPIGAKVLVTASGKTQTLFVHGGGSYASQSDYRVHAGLGAATLADSVIVEWPSGTRQTLAHVSANQRLTAREASR